MATEPPKASSPRKPIGFAEYELLAPRLEDVWKTAPDLPLFPTLEEPNTAETRVGGRRVVNFAGYNYLGLNMHPKVIEASVDAARVWGTNSGGSRLVSGQSTLHDTLEAELARFVGTEAAVVFTSGYSTNETVLGHLLGPGDLAIVDGAVHNSILRGLQLAGARVLPFRHNNPKHCRFLLGRAKANYERILIVIEGLYSMDGDIPELDKFIRLRDDFGASLMIDEAHSIGVLGATGRGITERSGVDPTEVDIIMGTVSKAFGSTGGFIAGARELIAYLRFTSPGFIFSGAPTPPSIAAALESVRLVSDDPSAVDLLRANSAAFRAAALDKGVRFEGDIESPIAPVLVPGWRACALAAEHLFHAGVLVQPVIYPAVVAGAERLRFFVTSEHTESHMDRAVTALVDALESVERSRTTGGAGSVG